ncbi:MAG: cupredoxin domain-containing protein, partial [bacterium]
RQRLDTMNATDWLVTLGGATGIAWVNWYFFLAERGATAALVANTPGGVANSATNGSTQSAIIIVHGGYEPSTIRVQAGQPVRLIFDRQETSSCSEEVVFPEFGVRKFLPANQRTTVVVTPPRPGTYEFTCGMSMLHGRLIAE